MNNTTEDILNKISISATGKTFYYNRDTLRNLLKKILSKKTDNKFLFILSPPYCGSTLLNEIISTSNNVSVNNNEGTREGQGLPLVRDIMFNHDRRWDESLDFDWKFIKNEWMKYWDLTAPILLEKSPPNLIRARSINKYFNPSYFIILCRNPYAHVESLMRREKWTAERAAEFVIRCLKNQRRNLESFQYAILLSYEELTDNPVQTLELLRNFLPELSDINIEREFNAHNFKNKRMKIANLNSEKISHFSPTELERIYSVFKLNDDIISFFNYEILEVKIGQSGN